LSERVRVGAEAISVAATQRSLHRGVVSNSCHFHNLEPSVDRCASPPQPVDLVGSWTNVRNDFTAIGLARFSGLHNGDW